MVCEWGMSEKMGPLAFGKKEGEVFLGREMTTTQGYSEQTAQDIDAEVRRIVTEQYERAKKVLVEHREQLARIADALLEYETLDAADIDVLMAGGTITRAAAAQAAHRPGRAGEGQAGPARRRGRRPAGHGQGVALRRAQGERPSTGSG